ncbi:unnamed protein product [Rotaria sp. Silwood2]|nr:unnamed protein product [Rotaria sp. Silwood2]CAF4194577.1 unnamed protein product [Rotaria sp. Silwood2]
MSTRKFRHTNESSNSVNRRERRQSTLYSSNPSTDSLPIDCILVYTLDDDDEHINDPSKMSRSERRERFEDYLTHKQGLILQHVKSTTDRTVYVKVHIPFKILLSTAENIRMKLPIEKITAGKLNISTNNKSCWHRFTHWIKKPFRLDPSLILDDIDYYTAIYSSNVEKFKPLFKDLRGSIDSYFTPSERSLLTYELLSRAHSDVDANGNIDDDHDDDDDNNYPQEPVAIRPGYSNLKINQCIIYFLFLALNTVDALRNGLRRPAKKTFIIDRLIVNNISGITRLIAKKAYVCHFPLHESLRDDITNIDDSDLNDREKLKKHWATMRRCLKFQPLSLIRSYMGEKITFYFALCGFYNQMLIPPALVGLIIFIYGAASVTSDQPISDICGSYGESTYMCPRCDKTCPFWKLSDSCVYSKVVQRCYFFDNIYVVVDFDSIDFDENLESIRPDFENEAIIKGEKRLNPVTNRREPFILTSKRVPFFIIAAAVVLVTMAIICGTVFATVVYRVQIDYILKQTSAKQYSSIIVTVTSAIMNLICSVLLSQFYYWIARKLTDLELHKYQSKYDDSLTMKIYLFQFVNFYSSLFYIAFFKGRFDEYPSKYGEPSSKDFTEQCDPAGCFVELSIQFLIIMTGKQIVGNTVEFFFAICGSCACSCCNHDKNTKREQWEIDKDLNNFETTTLIDEYLELGSLLNVELKIKF